MDRREFVGAVGLGLLIVPLAAEAQRAGRVYRLGLLHEASPCPRTTGRRRSGSRRPCASWATSKARTSSSNGDTPRASSTGFLRWRAKLVVVEVRGGDYARAFATIASERAAALFVDATPGFAPDGKRIIELAASHRLLTMYEWPAQVEDGGLMSYGSAPNALYRRAASYVDRIFKGTKPGDLPVEQPATFELVINLKTAKALGLAIPPTLLQRADRVIE